MIFTALIIIVVYSRPKWYKSHFGNLYIFFFALKRDGGGPLYYNGVLYGLIKSEECGPGSPSLPGLHTKVSLFVDWIRAKTGLYPSS